MASQPDLGTIRAVGLFDSLDRRNQRTLEKRNTADPVGPAGGVAVSSGSALFKIAPATVIGVVVLLVTAHTIWSIVGAIVPLVVGGSCCLVLARDVASDDAEWRRQRRDRKR